MHGPRPPQTTANCRKTTLKRSFCKEYAQIASLPFRMVREVIQVHSWPCNQLAILWMATTDFTVLEGWSVGTAGSSGPRVVHFGPLQDCSIYCGLISLLRSGIQTLEKYLQYYQNLYQSKQPKLKSISQFLSTKVFQCSSKNTNIFWMPK